MQTENGAAREVEVVANLYDEDGRSVIQFNIRDITERRKAEAALRERRTFLDGIFEVLPGVLYIFDLDENRTVFISNTAALTYSSEEVITMGAAVVPNLMHPDDHQGFQEHLARIRTLNSGETTTFEYRMRDRADEWRWYMSTDTVYLRDENGVARQFIGVAPEITDRKRAEFALRESEARQHQVLEASRIGTFDINLVSGDTIWNPTEFDLLGLKPGEAPPSPATFFRHVHPEDLAGAKASWETALQSGTFHAEFRIIRADGAIRFLTGRGNVSYDQTDDNPRRARRYLGVNYDITERKNAEAALQASEHRYRALIEATSAVSWSSSPSGLQVQPQPQWMAFTGQSAAETLGTGYARAFHPDDAENAAARWVDAVSRAEPFLSEHRIRRHDGEWRWMRVSSVPVYENGGIAEWFGMGVDVTDRKDAEAALRESEEKYRTLFDTMSEGVAVGDLIRDADGRVIDWRFVEINHAWERQTSVGRAATIGLTAGEMFPGLETFWGETVTRVVDSGEPEHVEHYATPVHRWYRASVYPRGAEQFVIVFDDISVRKRAEVALREDGERQAFLLKLSDDIRAQPDADAIGALVTYKLAQHLGLDRCYLAVLFPDEDRVVIGQEYSCPDLGPVSGEYRLSAFPEMVRRVQTQTVVMEDVANDPALTGSDKTGLKAMGIGAIVATGVREGDKRVLWSLVIASAKPRVWTSGEVAMLENIAERTYAAMEQARAEEQLRESEAFSWAVFEASPDCVKIIDAAGNLLRMNINGQVCMEIDEFDTVRGLRWPVLWPQEERAKVEAALAEAIAGRIGRFTGLCPTEKGTPKWWDVSVSSIPGAGGGPRQLMASSRDVTERKRHEEHIKLLMGEVNHRSKNMLSLVQAIARRTVATRPEDFIERFGQRVQALAASQDLLVRSEWKAVSLSELVRSQLAHFGTAQDSRVALDGPPVEITASASQALGMALHELATNAAKYGALSNETGRVAISWNLRSDAAGKARFTMSWIESGGPPVVKPARLGFGATVTGAMIKMSLGCDADVDFAPGGLVWRIDCPAGGMIEGSALPSQQRNGAAGRKKAVQTSGRSRVLVVEDEPLIAMDIAHTLAEAGYDVIGPAHSVAIALALIARSGCNAAVLDFNLGAETAEPVARELIRRGTPFVVMSGYAQAQQPEIMGSGTVLTKPVKSEALIAEIERCLADNNAS